MVTLTAVPVLPSPPGRSDGTMESTASSSAAEADQATVTPLVGSVELPARSGKTFFSTGGSPCCCCAGGIVKCTRASTGGATPSASVACTTYSPGSVAWYARVIVVPAPSPSVVVVPSNFTTLTFVHDSGWSAVSTIRETCWTVEPSAGSDATSVGNPATLKWTAKGRETPVAEIVPVTTYAPGAFASNARVYVVPLSFVSDVVEPSG